MSVPNSNYVVHCIFHSVMTEEGDKNGTVSYLKDALQRHSAVKENNLSLQVRTLPASSLSESVSML